MWLVEFDGAPAIIKQISGGPDAPARHAREVTALRPGPHGPARRWCSGAAGHTDPESTGVLVLEHLPSAAAAGRDAGAADYARALARLHATTTKRDAGLLPRYAGPGPDDAARFLALADQLGVRPSPEAAAELGALCERLQAADGFALLHGDPCLGQRLADTGRGVRSWTWSRPAFGDGLTELGFGLQRRLSHPLVRDQLARAAPRGGRTGLLRAVAR